jgi:hypothetical protein
MGIVNIPINVVSGVVQNPPTGNANRVDQQIVWTISNPPGSGITFQSPPVVFPTPPPTGYNRWVGTNPGQPGPGPNQWQANVGEVLPVGSSKVYKYDIRWTAGSLDPDISNQGYPPSTSDEDEDRPGKKDKKDD